MQDFKGKIKNIGKCVLFFVILFFLLGIISWRMVDYLKENEDMVQTRIKNVIRVQSEEPNTIDVLVMGDSLSYSSLSPLQMWNEHGFTTFTCGLPAQKIQGTYYMLKSALKTQSPKLLILESHVLLRDQKELKGLSQSMNDTLDYYFPVFMFHDIWKQMLMGTRYNQNSYKGFVIRDAVQSYNGDEYMQENDKTRELTPMVKSYMKRILDLCEENDIQVLLFSTASAANYSYADYKALSEYAAENNIKYLDANFIVDEIGLDWKKDSLDDGDHLNISGAFKVTKYVGDYISKEFDLSDRRDEEIAEKWNAEYIKFNRLAKKIIKKINED